MKYYFSKTLSIVLIAGLTFFANINLYAETNWSCFGSGIGEIFVPGLGYALNSQVDKAILIGGSRWYLNGKTYQAMEEDDYEDDSDKIYEFDSAEDSESGKDETQIYLNRSTWEANYYGSLDFNLLLITWGDLYQNNCEPNTETYSYMLSPFRIDHFYDNWMFWLPVLIAASNYQTFSDTNKVDYYLEKGLSKEDLKRDSFGQYYMVGVGEEMFFRGTVQHYFFETFKQDFSYSAEASRHLSIVGASLVFAAAHSGAGFTANPTQAFIFGVYEGYVYHPSLEEFDLMTAIAVHAWWDLLIAYAILNNAEYHEDQEDVYDEDNRLNASLNSQTIYPLLTVAFMF